MNATQIFFELFKGRETAYATKFTKPDGRKFFAPKRDEEGKDEPLTKEVCLDHIRGETSIGSYAFIDQEGHIQWAVIDFDGKRGDVLADANVVSKKLTQHGVINCLERSQSGNGIHIWIFFDAPVLADDVLRICAASIPEYFVSAQERKTSYDMIIPDTKAPSGEYGRLCALPLNGGKLAKEGKTAFIDPKTGTPYEDQGEWLEHIYSLRNSADAIRRIAKKFPAIYNVVNKTSGITPKAEGGIKLFSPYGCNWMRKLYEEMEAGGDTVTEPEYHAALGQLAKLHGGRELAHIFSKGDPRYSPDYTDRKFTEVEKANMPMRIDTIHEKFPGGCGDRCVCAEMKVKAPWELAKQSIVRLSDVQRRGQIYTATQLGEVGMKLVNHINDGHRLGYAWGYDILDDHTELRRKNLIVVAARRSVGKTAIMIDANINLAGRGIPQYVFSLEMSHEQLALRYLSRISEIDHSLIITGKLTPDQLKQLDQARIKLASMPIYLEELTRHPDKILDIAGELVYKHGNGCVWIDYLQMAHRNSGEKQKDAVDRAVASYTLMSKILDVPVISLAQLNRSEEQHEGESELDSWLKDSGNIEQDASVIHYVRGRLGPGTLLRKWRIHKERFMASGVDLKFEFQPHIYKFTPTGMWKEDLVDNDMTYELGNGGYEQIEF